MEISSSTVSVTSYNAHNINDGTNYRAVIPNGTPLLAELDHTYIYRLDDYPLDAKTHFKDRTIPLVISTAAGTVTQLKQWFFEGASTAKKLIVTDSSDSSAWYVYAKLRSFVKRKNATNVYDVVLSVADPIWKNNTSVTEDWAISSSGQTESLTIQGNYFARPIITITPRAVRTGGYDYKRFVAVYNQTDRQFVDYPFNITGGNLDHAALVTATKAQADGDDWRVIVDGSEVDRWTGGGGWNSVTARPWISINLEPKIELTLRTAVAASGATATLEFTENSTMTAALKKLSTKSHFVLLIENELFTFTDVTILGGRKVTGVTRAQFGTAEAAHAIGTTCRWIQHSIYQIYGLATATAPTVNSGGEPMIDKANSTNTSWVWTDYFDPTYPGRPGSWLKDIISSNNDRGATPTGHYGANQATNTDFSATASEMGMSIKAYQRTTWRGDSAELEWRLNIPSGTTTVTVSGEKYRATASWPATIGLQTSTNGRRWTTVWTEATPASVTTWTALAAHSAVALGATYQIIRFVMQGVVAGSANNLAHVEYDSLTCALDSNAVPGIYVAPELTAYYATPRIQNDTTGDYIDLVLPGSVDVATVVDCDAKTVTVNGVSSRASLTYGPDNVRQDWLTLDPTLNSGVNVISFTEAGLDDVDISVVYAPRSL